MDVLAEGIRPALECGVRSTECGVGDAPDQKPEMCLDCTACLDVCPAYENDHTEINTRPGAIPELKESCGPVLEVWEGHASDPEIRFMGSSGGLITALSLYCLEKLGMHGVLHVGADPSNPIRNKTTMSRCRQELLQKTGSRYAPASACDRLDLIETAPAPCVFVGQPTEVTAVRKAERLRPGLKQKVGLTISFFCAGSPATQGTIDLLRSKGIDPGHVQDLRYRGKGWPGQFYAILKGQSSPAMEMSYKESWGFVQAYRPFSVHLCPDGTGEDADISCGDPWYRQIQNGEAGSSLVVVRTERGREVVRGAMAEGCVSIQPSNAQKVVDSQRNLLAKRGAIWGRVMALRGVGLPAPRLNGFHLFKNWRRLSLNEQIRSTLGTVRRILSRGYRRPLRVDHQSKQLKPH